MRTLTCVLILLSTFTFVSVARTAPSPVILSEFMASNGSGLKDEDGEFSDWIELHNSSSNEVSLAGWYLTDSATKPTRWRFPATNVPPRGFLVLFASGKDRRVPGAPLHTNFKLGSGGGYLGLVESDGVTIASAFAPAFPPQAENVSYGYGMEVTQLRLVASNAPAKYFVPQDGSLGVDWTAAEFVDSGWKNGTNGVGYDSGSDLSEDTYAGQVSASAPVAWYRFSELSGSVATNSGSLGVLLNGTNVNATVSAATLKAPAFVGFETNNRSARLNGTTGRVRLPDHPSLHPASGVLSVELWFNPTSTSQRGDLLTLKDSKSELSLRVGADGPSSVTLFHDTVIGTGGGVTNSRWHHLVMTRDAAGLSTLFLNGVVLFEAPDASGLSISGDVLIGSNHSGNPTNATAFFNGSIDEVAFYPRVLPSSEVTQHYLAGFAGGASYASSIKTDVLTTLKGFNSSIYLRIPFVVTDLAALDRLSLRMKYDDGFVAWINGQEVGSRNAPDILEWISVATEAHPDSLAVLAEEMEIPDFKQILRVGTNVLALQGLNVSATNSDFLLAAELIGTDAGSIGTQPRYFRAPTPGAFNGVGSTDLGPIISEVNQSPALPQRPLDSEDLVVTARIAPAFTPLADVTLRYRVMFGVTNSVPMLDDGQHGDGAAGDGVFGAVIPAAAASSGQLIRYYVLATDTASHASRWPLFEDPLGAPEYLGTVVANSTNVISSVPIWEWFAKDLTAARADGGTRGALFFKGRLYDNIRIRRRGAATTNGQKFDFLKGFRCFISDELQDLDEVNLNNEASDTSFIRPPLAWETFRTAGNVAERSFHLFMRANAGADRVGIFVEQVDQGFLKRNGLRDDGALYKFVQRSSGDPIFTDPNDGVEKKLRLEEGREDLAALCNALKVTNNATNRFRFIMDNLNVPALLNHLACRSIIMDSDDVRKNIYMYRDTNGSGEWTIFPWDKDWSFGIEGDGGAPLRHPFFGDQPHRKPGSDQWSLLYHTIFNDPLLSEMYLRRLRTLMDQLLQPPGTLVSTGYFATRADTWFAPVYRHLGAGASNEVNSIKTGFLPGRRTDLYVTYSITNSAAAPGDRLVPLKQSALATLQFGDIEFNPASGNQAEEYIQLRNPQGVAIDISGWRVEGAISHTFRGGTVVRANDQIFLSPNVAAFRRRLSGPRGGQGLFVQGNYSGSLSTRGESIRLYDDLGRLRDTRSYDGTPSLAQRYLRITEIMYQPILNAGDLSSPDIYEYIELRNTSGTTVLDLQGVRFTSGIQFEFSTSAVTSLAPGERVVLVKSKAGFQSRYGTGAKIAGEYSGTLDDQGETLRLEDASGEKILEFTYHTGWYPATDGLGFSLVLSDDQIGWEAFGQKASWRPSGIFGGSPGVSDVATVIPQVIINEVLSHTLPPAVDKIELFNPGESAVDISGWYLSDDPGKPKKYRIAANTTVAAHGFVVFDEGQFNSGASAVRFSLSSKGDEVYLFSGNAAGALTGYADGFSFDAADPGVSFGRYVTSTGAEHWVAQDHATLGSQNGSPRVGPVVISEVMYHPIDLPYGFDNLQDEFIELVNTATNSVALFDSTTPSATWQLAGAVDFSFPTNVTLAPGETIVLSSFASSDPGVQAAFRARYKIDPAVRIFGPYQTKLDNGHAHVRLEHPITTADGEVVFVLTDDVEYDDQTPWPLTADGWGASLVRRDLTAYGNDVANWTATVPSPGKLVTIAISPSFTQQPQSATASAGGSLTLTSAAQGTPALRFQWLFQNHFIAGATNAVLNLVNLQADQAGAYRILVFNDSGSTLSDEAQVVVRSGPEIVVPPAERLVLSGTNVTLSVGAVGSGDLKFQWLLNGSDLLGATNASLVLSLVQPSDSGLYSVRVSDPIGSVTSRPVRLVVSIRPTLLVPPQNVAVVAGDDAVLSVVTSGTFPISYRWTRNSSTLTNQILNANGSVYVITNVQASAIGAQYQVVVTNLGGGGALTSTKVVLSLLADTDGDRVPDDWETAYHLDPSNPADGPLDSDGDGVSNRDEYLAGTDPTDPKSYLRIADLLTVPGKAAVEFQAVSNQTYSVVFRDKLGTGGWQKLADVPALRTNHVEQILDDAAAASQRFYRLLSPATR